MERPLKLDDEVRLAEERIACRRMELVGLADDLGERTRDAVASPVVLGTALAIGFVLGMRRPQRSGGATRRARFSDLLMAAIWPLVRVGSGAAIETLWNRVVRSRRTESLPLNPGATKRFLPPNGTPL